MKPDEINRWLTLAANAGVLIGIAFLAVEIRQNSAHLALQLEFQTTQKIFDSNRDFQDPERAGIFAKSVIQPEQLSFEEGLVAANIVLNMLNEWEDRYWIYKAGLQGELDWRRHIRENIEWTLGSRFALETYRANRGAFEAEFREFVDTLLADVSPDGTYAWWIQMQSDLKATRPADE